MRRSNSTDFAQPQRDCEAKPEPTSCSADNPELSRRSLLRASAVGAAAVLSNHVLGRSRLIGRAGSLLSPAPRPGWGVYRPEAPGNMAGVDSLASLARRVGTGPRLLLWYEAWRSPWATPSQLARQCRLAASAGCMPMLTWMTVDQTPSPTPAGLANAEVAGGSQDAYLMACAQALVELRAPVYLRFNPEMNGSGLPGQRAGALLRAQSTPPSPTSPCGATSGASSMPRVLNRSVGSGHRTSSTQVRPPWPTCTLAMM